MEKLSRGMIFNNADACELLHRVNESNRRKRIDEKAYRLRVERVLTEEGSQWPN